MDITLFNSPQGDVTKSKLEETLRVIGAADCDVLYVHSGITFGMPVVKRGDLLAEMLDSLTNLKVPTLIFPTFTFSFCNDEVFDVQKSSSQMGAINEFARKSGNGIRTKDPLLSVYVLGDPLNLVDNLGPYSIGIDSNYDRLRNCGKIVKFLFLGADMRECFTYTHHMEALLEVPYRYNREFSGIIRDNDEEKRCSVYLYSSYANCTLTPKPVVHDEMMRRGELKKARLGEGGMCCFFEKDATKTLTDLLEADPCCLTDGNFDSSMLDTTYNPNKEKIVSVR